MKISGEWLSNPGTQAVCRALTDAGHQALFVGGCVRNALLGMPVGDIDLATDAAPEIVSAIESKAGFTVVPTGIEHGTVTVVANDVPHEITTFRRDVKTDGRRAVVAFSRDVDDDARRRDFTMNALYADVRGDVIDPLGGLEDLYARRVRFIENAEDRIREDYLRILRFFRFHAWYGDPSKGLDPDGLAAIANNIDGLSRLARERVGAEIKKLLAAEDPAPAVAAMRATGVLYALLPGADDHALGPLIHLEKELGVAPDSIRRLAALGGENVASGLRLSKKEARRLHSLRSGLEASVSPEELGYVHGFETARDISLLSAAIRGIPLRAKEIERAARGAAAKFPLRARDLMNMAEGRALGEMMKTLERLWIDSEFRLSRNELLDLAARLRGGDGPDHAKPPV